MRHEHVLRIECLIEFLLAVTIPMEFFTISRQRSLLTVMPSTHSSVNVSMAFFSQIRLSKSDSVITGSITLS